MGKEWAQLLGCPARPGARETWGSDDSLYFVVGPSLPPGLVGGGLSCLPSQNLPRESKLLLFPSVYVQSSQPLLALLIVIHPSANHCCLVVLFFSHISIYQGLRIDWGKGECV